MASPAGTSFVPWTADADALVLRMAGEGFTTAEIGTRISRTRSAVQQRLSGLRRGAVGARSGRPEPVVVVRQAWSAAEVETVRRLWAEGGSHSAIGAELGRSKNAVVSKVHGLGLPPRAVAAPTVPVQSTAAAPISEATISNPAPAAPPEVQLPTRPRTVRECIWISGERPHYVSCAEPAEPGRPWCAEHCALGYVRGSSLNDRRHEHA